MKRIFLTITLFLITAQFSAVFTQDDKKTTDEIYKLITPGREMENDLELNPAYQTDKPKFYAAQMAFITKTEDILATLDAMKKNNPKMSAENLRLVDENIELFKRFADKWSSSDSFLKIAELNLQQRKYAEVFRFLKLAIEQEDKEYFRKPTAEKSKVAAQRYEQLKAQLNPTVFKYWDLDYKYFPKESRPIDDDNLRNEYIVGYVLDRGSNDRWDTLPYFIFRRAKLGEYATIKEAIQTTAQKSNQPFTVLQNKKTGKMTVFSAVPNKTNPVNLFYAANEGTWSYPVEPTPNFNFDYEGTRMNFDRNVILSQDNSSPDYKLIGIYDAKGLSVATTTNLTQLRGTRGMMDILNQEISAKNFSEAKQAYLYFDRMTTQTQTLDIVKSSRKQMLTKMYQNSPDLREFVEAEMTKANYTEADKKFVRGQ